MKKKTNIQRHFFIRIANREDTTEDDPIAKDDVEKLRKVLSDIVTENGEIPKTTEYDYFYRIAGSCETTIVKHVRKEINGERESYSQTIRPINPFSDQLCAQNDTLFKLSRSLCLFLIKEGNPKKIKQCLMCSSFFIAKDVKRIICYRKTCYNKYHAQDMKHRRKLAKKAPSKTN